MNKPIGILFESYAHFRRCFDIEDNIAEFRTSLFEWKLRGSEQKYIAIYPDTYDDDDDDDDEYVKYNKYMGIEFKDILGPDYKVIELPVILKIKIRP